MATLLTPAQSIAQAQGNVVTDPLLTNDEYIAKAQNYLIQNSVTVTPAEPTPLLSPEDSIKQAQTWPLDDQIRYRQVVQPQPKPNDELDPFTVTQAQVRIALDGRNLPPPSNAPNSGSVVGSPSTAALSRGLVFGTIKDNNNKKRAHVCGFIDEMRKNQKLKDFVKASAQYIREGIRAVLKFLGISDASGAFAAVTAKLKEAARWLKTVQKFLKDIINFERYVLAYITRIRAIIQWIMSLPAKLIALLAVCLAKFLKLIKSVMTDFFKELTAGVGGGSFGEAISATKELVNESIKTVNLAATAATGAVVIAGAATTGLLVPTSAAELAAANKTISNYSKTLPDGKVDPITQKKSTP